MKIALPSPVDENKLKEEYHNYWLRMDVDYKQHCLYFYASLLNMLGQAVAVAIIYSLNDNAEAN